MTHTTAHLSLKRKIANVATVGLLSIAMVAMIAPEIVSPVLAQNVGGRSITISPPTLSITVEPGEKTEGRLGLINDTSTAMSFDVFIYDMIVTDNQGTPELLPGGTIGSNKYSASSWIAIDNPVLTVEANSKADLNYYAQVPANAGPGGHYAAIVYKPRQLNNANISGAAVTQQVATLVYFDVAGPIKEQATVKSFNAAGFSEYGPVNLRAEVTNDGDTHIRAIGKMTVKDMFGKTIATSDIPEGNIFPGGISRVYEKAVGEKWMIGRYVASFNATYGRDNSLPLAATVAFWVFPWKIALIVLVLITAAILGYLYMKKNKKHDHQDPKDGTTTVTATTTTTQR